MVANPLGILAIFVALIFGVFAISDSGIFGGSGSGPIASGPGSAREIRNPQPLSSGGIFGGSSGSGGVFGGTPGAAQPKPGESPYRSKVVISTVERGGDKPDEEYVTIRYGGGIFGFGGKNELPLDVTGWRIGTERESEKIPRAYNIPEIDAVEQDIVLQPGGDLVVVIGAPSYRRNFRDNQCIGYLNETHRFRPSLSDSCVDNSIDRGMLLRKGFNGECIDAIDAVPSCRMPVGPFAAGVIGDRCINYMRDNFSYIGCVKNFRDTRDFLGDIWRVSLNRAKKMFNSRHDRVFLWDQSGLVVDEFEY